MSQDTSPQKQDLVRALFTEGVIIAVLTSVVYLAAFLFQQSYLEFFGIPWLFVDVNLSLILITAAGALVLVGGTLISAFLWRFGNDKFARYLGAFLLLFLVLYPILATELYKADPLIIQMLQICVYWLAGLLILVYLLGKRKIIINSQSTDQFALLTLKIRANIGPVSFATVCLFLMYCHTFGKLHAQSNNQFLIPSSIPNVAIISTYENNFLGVIIDADKKYFSKEIRLISKARVESEGIILRNENMGPLEPGR